MKFIIITGARPNFMKIAPLCEEFDRKGIKYEVFNSGQHYDEELNEVFQKQFNIKNIHNYTINCNNKVQDMQEIICSFKGFLQSRFDYDAVILVGDVDTTFACALTAKRYRFPIIHIEAGLRSFDHTMPEERNRITVDHLSNILFTSCHDAERNLYEEGIDGNIYFVGNIMIDCLVKFLPQIKEKARKKEKFIVVTFHRPENVDTTNIYNLIRELKSLISLKYNIIFPMHPRTSKRIKELKIEHRLQGCNILPPLNYIDFMSEVINAEAVVTDSGGIQEETTYLGIPCFTVRKNTERPITIHEGTNKLIEIKDITNSVINSKKGIKQPLKFWDGKTAERIVEILRKEF